jgi:hypothetical protein
MREAAQPLPAPAAEFLRRAQVAAEVARRAVVTPEPFEGDAQPILCHLYLHSVRCALRGITARERGSAPHSGAEQASPWETLGAPFLLRALGDPQTVENVKAAVDTLTLEQLTELAPADGGRLASASKTLALALIAELEVGKRIAEALWLQRLLRVGMLLVLAGLAVVGVLQFREASERRRDVAAGKPWHASSAYSVGGCKSPAQKCDESPDYFFHTQDERNPWIEFDLGGVQRISAVRVDNRKDCCSERSAPMVVEVSSDEHAWRPVARRDTVFNSWLATFAPTGARWVRLRLDKQAPLHLTGVRILR